MTKQEWIKEPKRLLLAGWPQRRDHQIDDVAYAKLLARFTVGQVNDAIEAMIGVATHRPTASEIAFAIGEGMASTPHDARQHRRAAKQAELDAIDAAETARREAEIEAFLAANPNAREAGLKWLEQHGGLLA